MFHVNPKNSHWQNWHIRKPFSRQTYLHVFFGIAQGREGDVAVSVEQEGEATVRFAKVPIAAAAAAAAAVAVAAPAAVVFVALVVDGAVAVGGDVVADADVGRNAGVAVAVSG